MIIPVVHLYFFLSPFLTAHTQTPYSFDLISFNIDSLTVLKKPNNFLALFLFFNLKKKLTIIDL